MTARMNSLRKLYEEQIIKTIQQISQILKSDDQDYINEYLHKVISKSFHRNILPQKHLPIVAEILNQTLKYDKDPKPNVERDWFIKLDKLIHFVVEHCSVCGNKLHNQGKFPSGFPEKWKLCCRHLESLQHNVAGENDNEYDRYKEKFEEFFIL